MEKGFAEKIAYLKTVEAPFVCDALLLLGIDGWIDDLSPMQKKEKSKFVGPVYPAAVGIAAPGEKFYALQEMIDACPEGHVLLVADGKGQCVMGDNAYRCAENKKLTAVVLDGKIRDSDYIAARSMPFFSSGITGRLPKSPIQITKLGVPVECRGLKVNPGDIAVGDCDGVVVIPQQRFEEVVSLVEKIAEIEKNAARLLDENCAPSEILKLMRSKKELVKK